MNSDPITIWFVAKQTMKRGQGKRTGGMIKGGMSAMVQLPNRIETTIGELRNRRTIITQRFLKVKYHNVIMDIENAKLDSFLDNPKEYTLKEVQARLCCTLFNETK